MQLVAQRLGSVLPHLKALRGRQRSRIGLEPIQPGDALQRLVGNFAGVGLDERLESPRVRIVTSTTSSEARLPVRPR
jgi:hypothetical protein